MICRSLGLVSYNATGLWLALGPMLLVVVMPTAMRKKMRKEEEKKKKKRKTGNWIINVLFLKK